MFKVSHQKELNDTLTLSDMIEKEGWIDSDTIIVNCSPDYSSIVCQIINHKLSKNELYEQIPLEMPYPTMNQIWNRETAEYELFDTYLKKWVNTFIAKYYKYLFIDSGTLRGQNFTKLKAQLRDKLEPSNYRFASLYLQDDSIFTPDYYVEKFNFKNQGGLIFEWENPKNPNWNY